MIAVEGLHRSFGATLVLRGLDLHAAAGERIAIVGDNGSGKTTLVRVLAGLLRPSAGSVRVDGSPPSERAARRKIGLLAHDPFLYGHLTASENLRLWGRLYDVQRASGRAAELLDRLGLDPDDRRTVDAYSRGMRQRAALARALLHDPALLLLDEPFAGLDDAGSDAAAALLDEGTRTVVVTSHRPDERAAGRRLRLHAGRLGDA